MPLRTDADTPSTGNAASRALSRINSGGGVGTTPYGPFAAAAEEDPPVYMGKKPRSEVEPRGLGTMPATSRKVGDVDQVMTRTEALDQFYRWVGTPKMDQWGDHLVAVGLIDEEDKRDYATLSKYWQAAVEEAANAYAADKSKKIDPWKMAEFMGSLGAGGSGGGRAGNGGGGKGGTFTSTSTSVDLTDPETARALVNNVLSNQLGREATPDEIASFTAVLSQAERSNPATTVTTTTQDAAGNSTSSSTTSGGLTGTGKQEVLRQEAMRKPEYGAYQAAATYLPALFQAIGAPV